MRIAFLMLPLLLSCGTGQAAFQDQFEAAYCNMQTQCDASVPCATTGSYTDFTNCKYDRGRAQQCLNTQFTCNGSQVMVPSACAMVCIDKPDAVTSASRLVVPLPDDSGLGE